jgi:cbb3-type cytochrome oxidase subunit 3
MSYQTVVQLIAAAITIAFMAAFGFGLDRFLDAMSPDFIYGAVFGGLFFGGIIYLAAREDRSAADAANRRQQQCPRNSIDL